MAEEQVYHLHRQFTHAPFLRWACDIVEDEHTDDGYRVVDHDPQVATPGWFGNLSSHLSKAHQQMTGGRDGRIFGDGISTISPGDEGYFPVALHRIENTLVGSGRQLG